jgi:hypothetical protein
LSSSKVARVPEDSKFPLLGVWVSSSHLPKVGLRQFVFLSQVQQVFYFDESSKPWWKVILHKETWSKHMFLNTYGEYINTNEYGHVLDAQGDMPNCCNPSFGLTTKAKGLQGCGPRESPGVTPYTLGSVGKCHNLSFGLATKAKGLQGCGPTESSGVTSHTHGSVEKCEGVNPHTPKATFTLGDGPPVDSRNFRERFQGSNSMACGVLYIIGKLLELRCLKWAHIAHLDIKNTSYGQKKGRESNYQFDSRPKKIKNRPYLLVCRWRATYHWKALDEGYNFSLDYISIWGLLAKLWGSKVAGVPTWAISGLPLGSPGTKNHLDVGLMERCKVYYKGEGGGFPQVRAMVSLVCPCCPWFVLASKVLQLRTNHLVWVLCRLVWVNEACQLFLVPSQSSSTPLYPSKCYELGSVPWLLFPPLFSTWTHTWVFQGVGSASLYVMTTKHHFQKMPNASWKNLIIIFAT